MHVKQ